MLRAQKFIRMRSRRFALVFLCQLVNCHFIPHMPNLAKIAKTSIAGVENPLLSNAGNPKIIGGESAHIEQYPYIVSIQQNGTFFGHDFEHFCVGTIIGEKWIVTAAKCCKGKNPRQFHVRIGSESYYEGGSIHEIESIKIHPKYDDILWDYDVGLLELNKRIIFGEKVQPIKLPKQGRSVQSGIVLDIAGWGATKLLGMPSDKMNHNKIPTISQEDCRYIYSINSVTDRMFCAFDSGNGPCIGDTGSPAVLDHILIGVASWSQSCAYKHPTAYARLPEMVDWITQVTGISSTGYSEPAATP